jgi:hypothetical protein
MPEGEHPRVQHLPRRVGPAVLGVHAVAEHRVAEVCEMDAHLVLASRLQTHLEQRGVREALDDAPLGDRLAGGLVAAGHAPAAALVGVVDGRVDGARVVARHAGHEHGVAALHGVGAEDRAQRVAHRRLQGEGERARRVAVEAVHDTDVRPPRARVARELAHARGRRVLVVGARHRRHGEEPGRLVDHEERTVAEEHRQVDARARQRTA